MDWHRVIPDKTWYLRQSKRHQLLPRCPFAHLMKCPRYYQSVDVLGEHAGFAPIDDETRAQAEAFWQDSPLNSNAPEDTPVIDFSGRHGKRPFQFRHLCPEVAGERFGLFCSDLIRPSDDALDQEVREKRLLRENVPALHPRWTWDHLVPLHFHECSLYSVLSHATERAAIRLPRRLPFDVLSGREFEELVYAYLESGAERRWKSLQWLGLRGHDGGRDIWAVAEDGRNWCFLCANHHPLRLRKVREDLDALCNWSRQDGHARPQRIIVVAGDQDIGAGFRDDAKEEARERGWVDADAFELWSGAEVEVKLKTKCPAIAEQFFVRYLVPVSASGLSSGKGDREEG